MGIESFREYCHVLAESHRQNIPPSLWQIADEEPKLNEIFGRLGGIWNWLTGKKSDAAAEPEQRDEPAAAPLTGRARRKAQRQRGKFAMGLVRDDDTSPEAEKSRAAFDARRKKDKLDFIDRFVTNFASNFGNADYDPGHPYAAVHPDFVNQALKARGYPELTPEELKMFGKPEGGRKRGAPRGKVEKKDYAPMFGTYDSDDEGIASRPPEPPAPAPRTKRRVEDFL